MKWKAKEINDSWVEYQLISDKLEVHFLNYGGIITKIMVPDKHGKMENIILAYDQSSDYQTDTHFLGALIGRVGGRIPHARFQQGGRTMQLTPNEGAHQLHGGPEGFHCVLWQCEVFRDEGKLGVRLKHTSPAGANGYPGQVQMTITYAITTNRTFHITYEANANTDTLLSPTNHMYLNLCGDGKGTIHEHRITANCDQVLAVDEALLPTGELFPVEKTPFDFRTGQSLKTGIMSEHPQNHIVGHGYDHYCVFAQGDKRQVLIQEPQSGRKVCITTTYPGFVLYSANSLDNGLSLNRRSSVPYQGVCVETQAHPASLDMEALESVRLSKDTVFQQQTTYQFT